MGKSRWLEILGSLDFSSGFLMKLLQKKVQALWNCGTDVAADESMIPYRGRRNPHHVYIPNKPHPNGIKLYTAADSSHYIFNFTLHRRAEEIEEPQYDPILYCSKQKFGRKRTIRRKTVVEVVLDLVSPFSQGHCFYLDSYYGGLDLVRALVQKGYHAIMTCKSNRPSLVFRDLLQKEDYPHFGSWNAAYGWIEILKEKPKEQYGEDTIVVDSDSEEESEEESVNEESIKEDSEDEESEEESEGEESEGEESEGEDSEGEESEDEDSEDEESEDEDSEDKADNQASRKRKSVPFSAIGFKVCFNLI